MAKINPHKELIPLHRNEVRESFRLSHYTSISVLFKMLRKKQIKFNRIDNVNDLTEKELLYTAESYKRVFISCFSKRVEESIPMWKMYTSKNDGIMLSFIPKKDTLFRDWFDLSFAYAENKSIAFSTKDVVQSSEKEIRATLETYNINYKKSKMLSSKLYIKDESIEYLIPNYFATYKDKAWAYEKEFRFRFLLKSNGTKEVELKDYFSLFVNLNFDAFEKIIIVFSPEIDKLDWQDIIEDFKNKNGIATPFSYQNSKLRGKIKL